LERAIPSSEAGTIPPIHARRKEKSAKTMQPLNCYRYR